MRQSKFLTGAIAMAAVALFVGGCGGGTGSGGGSVIPSQNFQPGGSPTAPPSHGRSGPMNTPGPIAQTHVITWQDETGLQNPSFTWDQIAQYVNYSVVTPADNAAAKTAGVKTIIYTDPNRVYSSMPEYSNDETTFAHDCSNNRITIKGTREVTYLMQPTSTALVGLWQQHIADYNRGGHADFDVAFDDTPLVHKTSALPCGYDRTAWMISQNVMSTNLNYPVIFNGLGNLADGPSQLSPAMALLPTSLGGMMEGCYSNYSGYSLPATQQWKTYENTEIQVLAAKKLFVCRGFDNTPDTSAHVQRLYMYGSFLLTYDPALAIFSPKFKTVSNGFWIQPENQLIALDPIVPQPSNIDQLNQSPSVYGRQYQNCYYAGQWVGACASIVNSDKPTRSHPMPWTGVYQHTLVVTGGDILDGGTASTVGPAPPANIPGSTAIIVIQ